GQLQEPVQAAVPLGFRHAAMPLEAPPRAGPLRLVWPRDAAVAVAVPSLLPGHLAAGGPADPLGPRQSDRGLDALRTRPRLAAAAERDGVALPRRVHVRVLLRHRAARLVRRLQARWRETEGA